MLGWLYEFSLISHAFAALYLLATATQALFRWLISTSKMMVVIFLSLVLVAACLRLLAPSSPHDINDRLTLAFVHGNQFPWAYGVAPIASARVVTGWGVLPAPDLLLYDVYALIGAATAGLTAGWAFRLSRSRVAGLAAGISIALWPAHIRLSHTDAPQIPQTACLMLALWMMASPTSLTRRDWFTIGVATSFAVNMRPEGIVMLPLAAAWAFLSRRDTDDGTRTSLGAFVPVLLLVGPHIIGMWLGNFEDGIDKAGLTCRTHGVVEYGPSHFAPFHAVFGSTAVAGLALLSAVGPRRTIAVRTLTAVSALGLGATIPCASWSIGTGAPWALVRHQLTAMPFFAALAGWGCLAISSIGERLTQGHSRLLPAISLLAMTVDLVRTTPLALRPRTLDAEFAFARSAVPRIPDGCSVVAFFSDEDDAFAAPRHLSDQLGKRHHWYSTDDITPADLDGCWMYYRSSACVSESPASRRVRQEAGLAFEDRCAPFESQFELVPLEEIAIPSEPWLRESYHSDPIAVGIYSLRPPKP